MVSHGALVRVTRVGTGDGDEAAEGHMEFSLLVVPVLLLVSLWLGSFGLSRTTVVSGQSTLK